MKILLLGYGKMGKAIERIAKQHHHEIVAAVDAPDPLLWEKVDASQIDVALEFSQPEAAYQNIIQCIEHQVPVVSGTTGWLTQREKVEQLCIEKGGMFLYASNFSLGMNIFFQLNSLLAQFMTTQPQYEVAIEETHHTEKLDAPSGTAITLAEDLVHAHEQKNCWVKGKAQHENELGVTSHRLPEVPGEHEISYTSSFDTISIKHTAHTRDSFALGALKAAEWAFNKNGVLTMKDFLKDVLPAFSIEKN